MEGGIPTALRTRHASRQASCPTAAGADEAAPRPYQRPGTDGEMHVLSATVAWMLLIPPVSWAHYFMLLLLPLTTLVAVAMGRADEPIRGIARVALVAFAALALALAGSRAAQVYGPLCWGTLAVWVALIACARACRTSPIHREYQG